jgi:ABC-type branched-chain amino acid transport systems, ATPase component
MSPDHSPLLIIDGLVKQFGGFRALDGLSFSLAAGEILGLVGPNGSGKTTCINIVSGLYTPDGGSIDRKSVV